MRRSAPPGAIRASADMCALVIVISGQCVGRPRCLASGIGSVEQSIDMYRAPMYLLRYCASAEPLTTPYHALSMVACDLLLEAAKYRACSDLISRHSPASHPRRAPGWASMLICASRRILAKLSAQALVPLPALSCSRGRFRNSAVYIPDGPDRARQVLSTYGLIIDRIAFHIL